MADQDLGSPIMPKVEAVKITTTSSTLDLLTGVPTPLQSSLSPQPVALPPFAVALLHHARASWGKSFTHPFVTGLEDGTLPLDKFRRYLIQDARYLGCFGDACAILSSRVLDPQEKVWFLRAAITGHEVEAALHMQYGKQLGFTPADVAAAQLSPAAEGYTAHMLRCAAQEPLVVAIAALAPCPWLYSDVGLTASARLKAAQGIPADDTTTPLVRPGHPYGAWLATYAGDGMSQYVREQLYYLTRHAQDAGWGASTKEEEAFDFTALEPGHALRRAAHAFHTSARYEYMFWCQGWSDEAHAWPV